MHLSPEKTGIHVLLSIRGDFEFINIWTAPNIWNEKHLFVQIICSDQFHTIYPVLHH